MAAVILLLFLISKPLKKKVSASSRYLLWALIAVRLCIPVSLGIIPTLVSIPMPEAPAVSVENETAEALAPETAATADKAVMPAIPHSEEMSGNTVQDVETQTQSSVVQSTPETKVSMPSIAETEKPERKAFDLSLISYFIFAAWCAGALISLSIEMAKYFSYRRHINDSLYSADEDMLSMYRELCAEMEIGNYPPLFLSKKAESPMLMGYFSPCIVYPESLATEKSMWELISHELTHYRRCDLWIKLMAVLARSLHWFNPAVYVAAARLEAEMELSCDEKTLRGKCGEDRLAYGQSMLQVVKSCSEKSAPLTTNFNPHKEAVKERLMNIFDTTEKRKGIALISVILALCIVSGSIVGCNVSSQSMAKGEETKTEEAAKSAKNEPKKFEDGEWQKLYGRYLMENQWENTYEHIFYPVYYPGEGLFYIDDINGDSNPDLVVAGERIGASTVILTEKDNQIGEINFIYGGATTYPFLVEHLRYTEDGSRICFKDAYGWSVFEKNDTDRCDYVLTHFIHGEAGKYYYQEVLKDKLLANPNNAMYDGYRGETSVELTKEDFDAKLNELGLSDDKFKSFTTEDMYVIDPENIEAQLGYKASDKENAPAGAAFTEAEIDELGKTYGDTALSDEVKKFIRCEHDISRNFTFGDWYVTMALETNDTYPTAYVTVDITGSSLERVKPGVHIFKMESGLMGVSVEDIAITPDYRCVNNTQGQFIRTFYNMLGYKKLMRAEDVAAEDMKSYAISIYDFVGAYFGSGRTKEEYMNYAENIFGVRNDSAFETVFDRKDDGTYESNYGHGGANIYYEFIASDNNSVTVQLYADSGYFVKSDVIKYNFRGELNDMVLVSVETVHESENEPFVWFN